LAKKYQEFEPLQNDRRNDGRTSEAVPAATLNEIELAVAKVRATTAISALADLAQAKLQTVRQAALRREA